MSFLAAKGGDLRADRDLPGLIIAGNAGVAAKDQQLDALQKEVDALAKANCPQGRPTRDVTRQAGRSGRWRRRPR